MKKHFLFLLFFCSTTTLLFAQAKEEKNIAAKNPPHLTFGLLNDAFYYLKGADTTRQQLQVVDSSTIAALIDEAVAVHKVEPKKLNVVLQGDDLMLHPQFDVLINTILSKTVSEVRVKTNLF